MRTLNKVLVFISLFVFSLFYNWVTTRIANSLSPGSLSNDGLKDFSVFTVFVTTTVVAPLLETLLGQFAPIELMSRFKKIGKPAVCIGVSALIFAKRSDVLFIHKT